MQIVIEGFEDDPPMELNDEEQGVLITLGLEMLLLQSLFKVTTKDILDMLKNGQDEANI